MTGGRALGEEELLFLNAYVDGELDAADARAWSRRVETDPAAAAAHAEIVDLKQRVGRLTARDIFAVERNEPEATPALRRRPARGRNRHRRLVVAGSLVAALGLGVWAAPDLRPTAELEDGLLAWHDRLSADEFSLDPSGAGVYLSVARLGDYAAPDLTSLGLRLIEAKAVGAGAAAFHYRGAADCRLTVWTGPASAAIADSAEWPDVRRWTIGARAYGVAAAGLDPRRIGSIADFVEADSRRQSGRAAAGAVDDLDRLAAPCS